MKKTRPARIHNPEFQSILIVPILPLIAAGLVFFAANGCDKGESQPGGRTAGSEAIPVDAVVLKLQPIEKKIVTTGTLLANEEVELRPEISGRVTDVLFEEGRKIRKGDVLVKLNDRELQAQLRRKQLEETEAAADERRMRSLLDINGISQEEYDKVLNNLNMLKAEREVIESQLAETQIRAPFDGIVGLRHVSVGSVISPSTLIAAMQDIDPIKAEFSIPEKYSGELKTGTPVTVTVGDSSESFEGKVYAVESKVDPATRTLKARASIANPEGRLIPGSFCKIEIILQHIADAIVVPAQAVVPELNSQKVYVCQNGKARSIPVTIGVRTDREVQITDGLRPDDTLIVTGLLQLRDGRAVRIKPAADTLN